MEQSATKNIVSTFAGERPPLLPVLLAVQSRNPQKYVDVNDINEIASLLHVSKGSVYFAASCYQEIALRPMVN